LHGDQYNSVLLVHQYLGYKTMVRTLLSRSVHWFLFNYAHVILFRVMADISESLESRGDSRKRNVSRRELFCPHCDCLVPKTTYYRYREQFYNPIQDWVWSAVKLNTTTTMPVAGANSECECEEMDFATLAKKLSLSKVKAKPRSRLGSWKGRAIRT